jgi:hypothetical protein
MTKFTCIKNIWQATSMAAMCKTRKHDWTCGIFLFIIYTRSGYEVFCNLIGSLLAGY